MIRQLRLPLSFFGILLLLVAVSEAWGGDEGGQAPPGQAPPGGAGDGEGGDAVAGDEGGGGSASPQELRRRKVLEQLPGKPDLLINLGPEDLPATSDMVQLGKPATPAVLNGLVNSMSPKVRAACAAVLTATRDPRALESLTDALGDPDQQVVRLALQALGNVESRQATPKLLALLRQQRVPAFVKEEAVRALGRAGDPAAVKPLLEYFLKTWDAAAQLALWDLRRQLERGQLEQIVVRPLQAPADRPAPATVLSFSVEQAGELKLRAAGAPLRRLFEDNVGLQNHIVHTLGLIGDKDAVPFLHGLLDRTAEARLMNNVAFALQRLGQDVQPFLSEALADRRAYIRFNAAFVAGDLKLKGLVPVLHKALEDPNDFVRTEVAVALGKIGAADSVAPLEQASKEWNPIVRRDALLALAAIDYPRYRARVVTELVGSKLPSVRQKAVGFLAEKNDETVVAPVLAALDPGGYGGLTLGVRMLDGFSRLNDPDATAFLLRAAAGEQVRHDALRLLGRFADERARFALRQWLKSPAGEQEMLLRAMGRYQDKDSLPEARRWLAAPKDAGAQLHAAFLLAALGEKDGGDRLLAALEEAPAEGKATAARLLSELDPTRQAALQDGLARMLEHPDVYVRLYAARALAERGDARAIKLLWAELAKKIPFVLDEVLDIVERLPPAVSKPVLEEWIKKADPLLRPELERIRDKEAGSTRT